MIDKRSILLKRLRRGFIILFAFTMLFLITGCSGNKGELSRSKAAKMIKEVLQKDTKTEEIAMGNENGIMRFSYPNRFYYEQGHQKNNLGDKFDQKFIALSEKGLITYKTVTTFHDDAAERHPQDSNRFYYDEYSFDITSKANPYIVKEEKRQNWNKYSKVITVLLAELDDVEVTGLTQPAEAFGQKMIEAEYTAKYKQTPFGEVFITDRGKLIKKGRAGFVLYDDGWRLVKE